MAKAKKTTKKISRQEWAAKVAKSRYGDFTRNDLQAIHDSLLLWAGSIAGKIKAMEERGIDTLTGVYGATQPARIEREMKNFLGNISRAIEQQ